jgi:drug/metabolite transporter (DMT)-like permease
VYGQRNGETQGASITSSGLALASSLAGGASDFVSGSTSRLTGTAPFMFFSQLIGVVLAGGWVAVSGERLPGAGGLALAVAAGLGMALALGALIQGMVVGTISVVAPVSATGVVLPVFVGVIDGNRPSAAQGIGIAAAIAGVWLVGRPPIHGRKIFDEPGLALGLMSALGNGIFFWLMAPASSHGAPWAVLMSRVIPALGFGIILAVRRPSLQAIRTRSAASAIAVSSVLGSASLALYAFATQHGALAIVSVLASLYPAVTVLLAFRLLGERVRPAQKAGIGILLVAVTLIAAG